MLLGACGFGALMGLLADLAGRPNYSWVQWVVNWGALWLVVPLVAGQAAASRRVAASVGGLAAMVEVATYYRPSNLVQFKIAWMLGGAVVAALIGAGASSRSVQLSWLIPTLMLAEPIMWIGLFVLLGRPASPGLMWSGLVEAIVGVVVGFIGCRRRSCRSAARSENANSAAI
jgi:hypothetical protein